MGSGSNLSGNIADFDKFEAVIHDYQTAMPQLILTCEGYFGGEGVGTISIPARHCIMCGRKLGKWDNESANNKTDTA